MPIPELPLPVLEQLSNVLADTSTGLTGSEIGRYLQECGIPDPEPATTKRIRLYNALRQKQAIDRCANNVIAFLQAALSPVRHTTALDYFDRKRAEVNNVLVFVGLEFTDAGQTRQVQRVDNLRAAALRADRLRQLLKDRNVHPDVLSCCREELLVENYFHAVLEATKSVAEKIRQRTGLINDGSELVDDAFSFKARIPHLALNSLTTESEQSEQKGFMNLLKGLFGTFRNPIAHAPKLTWSIVEQDALDILSIISLAHRRIDAAIDAYRISINAAVRA
jgi:uncharacterized protein (TIGR02391 family)